MGQIIGMIKQSGDMAFFKKITSETTNKDLQNAVIMGRKTWESIPDKFRPLPNRVNIVISTTIRTVPEGVYLAPGFDEAVSLLSSPELRKIVENAFIIGGSSVYNRALSSPLCHRIYLTQILKEVQCDTFMPDFDMDAFALTKCPNVNDELQKEGDYEYKFEVYQKKSACTIRPFNVCAAMLEDRGIGRNGTISWTPIKKDFEHYLELTSKVSHPEKKCVNIKGRITWEESTELELSRPNIINIIVSKTMRHCPKYAYKVVDSWDEALHVVSTPPLNNIIDCVWVMGGMQIYQKALKSPHCHRLYLTRIQAWHKSDCFFPEFENDFKLISDPNVDGNVQEENGTKFQFEVYEKQPAFS